VHSDTGRKARHLRVKEAATTNFSKPPRAFPCRGASRSPRALDAYRRSGRTHAKIARGLVTALGSISPASLARLRKNSRSSGCLERKLVASFQDSHKPRRRSDQRRSRNEN